MAPAADYPKPLDRMTHAELFDAALAAGMRIEVSKYVLQLSTGPKETEALVIDTGLLGRDRGRLRRVGAIDREMKNRWAAFVAYAKARLAAA